jgi:uncharacterized protein
VIQPAFVAFGACIALGFTVEAGVGFGGTLIALGLGAWLLPIADALAIFLPLNLALSLWMAARQHRAIRVRWLFGEVVPTMVLGMPLGVWLATRIAESPLKRGFGVFVFGFAVRELTRGVAAEAPPSSVTAPARQSRLGWLDRVTLLLGGIAHGAFATGGPFAVVVAGRSLTDKSAFRATLAALWAVLNLVVAATLAWRGNLTVRTLGASFTLAPVLPLAFLLGEWLHQRVPAATFRRLTQLLLIAMGLRLIVVG